MRRVARPTEVVRAAGSAAALQKRASRPNWTTAEEGLLVKAVQQMGYRWRAIATSGLVPGRTAQAVKRKLKLMHEEGKVEELAHTATHDCCLLQQGSAADVPQVDGPGGGQKGRAPRMRRVSGAAMAPLTGWPQSQPNQYQLKRAKWTQGVKWSWGPPRAPRPWQLAQISLWGLRGRRGAGVRAVSVGAEQQARKLSGGRRGCSVGSRSKLRTLLAAPSQRLWLYGPQLRGGGRFAWAVEYAWWMGMRAGDPGWSAARRLLAEEELRQAVALAVDSRVADLAVQNAMMMLAKEGWRCETGAAPTVISLYAGALDSLQAAVRRSYGRTRCTAVAESCPLRAACLRAGYLIPESEVYLSTEELVRRHRGQADWLLATPPCALLSTAPKMQRAAALDRAALARAQTRAMLELLREAAMKFCPRVIMMEQTSGLRTHHAALYQEVQDGLQALPFTWRHGLVRAERLGAPHRRARLLWVGVRRARAVGVGGGS